MPSKTTKDQSTYPIGQSPEEMRRLSIQADVLHTQPTRWMFECAGIRQSMRVLDIGCGAGDGSFVAADFVGRNGKVIGLDNSVVAIETANARAKQLGLTNTTFIAGDLRDAARVTSLASEGKFDAIVGRAVLMYLPDPAETLRNYLPVVRPGGIVAFREVLIGEPIFEAIPAAPLVDLFNEWYRELVEKAYRETGIAGQTGLRLPQIFLKAGLPEPHMWLHAPIGHAPDWLGWEYLNHQVEMLTALGRKAGLATPPELDPSTFGEQVRSQVLEQRGVLRIQRGIQAWTVVPGQRMFACGPKRT